MVIPLRHKSNKGVLNWFPMRKGMNARYNRLCLQMKNVAFVFIALQLHFHGCVSRNLKDWNLREHDPCKWNGVQCVDGKPHTSSNLKSIYSQGHADKYGASFSSISHISQQVVDSHSKNLPAAAVHNAPLHAVQVPFRGTGSFAAVPDSSPRGSRNDPMAGGLLSAPAHQDTVSKLRNKSAITSWLKWIYTLVIPVFALILILIVVLIVSCRSRSTAIGPWRSGLSAELTKAFVTGVPRLKRAELEAACEDFSNIIITYPNCTVYKGTLSTGTEIAAVSTKATSLVHWSERSEFQFRHKIDTMSRVNHKNFVNLLGFCDEDDPFTRMLLFEYAPNGTLFEHLHVKEYEPLEWSARMRILMGIAYCLQEMHNLEPQVVHPILQSSCIFITDDFAAKVADLSIFSEPAEKKGFLELHHKGNFALATAYPESNVYSFGVLLLEIISGRMPICEEDGLPILDWAMEHLRGQKSIKSLVDPSLEKVKDEELKIICKVAELCIHEDPKSRPTMKQVTASLREVTGIVPEMASPGLSPLWWAELELLSIEAS